MADRLHRRHAFARRLHLGQPRTGRRRRHVPRLGRRAPRDRPPRGAAGDQIELAAAWSLRAIATPGHTPDHLAYLLCEDDRPAALFSGGSLMVGTVGRTDLLGPEPREDLARQLFRALRDEILTLPDDLPVYPTHGAGSFCSAPGASRTHDDDRAANAQRTRCCRSPTRTTFVEQLVAGFGTFPATFAGCPR